jgi:hypothetical protein
MVTTISFRLKKFVTMFILLKTEHLLQEGFIIQHKV